MSKKKLIPELRFPEFSKSGEWKEETLDEVATLLKGKGIAKSDIIENGKLPCIRYGELYTHYNELVSIDEKIEKTRNEHNQYLKELGLPPV